MQISINQIMQMPNAAIIAERIACALNAEKKERLRFYEIIEEDKKMEFINGEIVFQSPAKLRHTKSIGYLDRLLGTYVDKNELGFIGSEKMLISLTRNDYEPDICYFNKTVADTFKPDQMQFPAPDFIVEVLSPSTEKTDRTIKFEDYAAHNVQEYWIIDAEKETVEQYFLQNEVYELLLKAKNGTITSVVLPNFTIQIRAIFDKETNLQELKKFI
jgi:Uma2 family endonuclease